MSYTYINLPDAMRRLRDNKSMYKRLLGMFLKSTEFAAFEEAIAAGNMEAAGNIAHAIKGLAGNLSLMQLFETSTALMHECRAGAAKPESLAAYRAALTATIAEVEAYIAES